MRMQYFYKKQLFLEVCSAKVTSCLQLQLYFLSQTLRNTNVKKKLKKFASRLKLRLKI